MKKIILFILLSFVSLGELFAAIETPSTQGSEFYMSFNCARYDRTKEMSLTVSADSPGLLIVKDAKGDSVIKPFIAGVTRITLVGSTSNDVTETVHLTGLTSCYTIKTNIVQDRGYILYARKQDGVSPLKVSIYAALDASGSIDAANIYPIEALGNEYYVISHAGFWQNSTPYKSEALVMATEDNTIIEIKPTGLLNNQVAIDDIRDTIITLNKGQTYQIQALDLADLTGTLIRTKDIGNNKCKKIAVFTGIQHGFPGDFEYDQIFPVHLQGSEYLIAPPEQGREVVRIVASAPCTEVKVNGQVVAVLNQTDHYDFIDPSTLGCYVQTSKPVGVAMYTTDFITPYRNPAYDASMTVLAPINQMLDSIIFTTPATGYSNVLNIVSLTEFKDSLFVYQLNAGVWDLVPLSTWTDFAGTPDYKFMNLPITQSYTYKIVSQKGGFNAYVYGSSGSAMYSYSVGAAANVIKTSFDINGVPFESITKDICLDKFIEVEPKFPEGLNVAKVEWDFESDGVIDSTTYKNNKFRVSYSYANSGVYNLKMIVYKSTASEASCWIASGLTDVATVEFSVKSYVYEMTKRISLCKADSLKSVLPAALSSEPITNVRIVWATEKVNGNDSLLLAYDDKLNIDIPLDYGESRKYWRRIWVTTSKCDVFVDTFVIAIPKKIINSLTCSHTKVCGDGLTQILITATQSGDIISTIWEVSIDGVSYQPLAVAGMTYSYKATDDKVFRITSSGDCENASKGPASPPVVSIVSVQANSPFVAMLDVTSGEFIAPYMLPISGGKVRAEVSIDVPGSYNYLWTPIEILAGSTFDDKLTKPKTYMVYVEDADGLCKSTTNIITVKLGEVKLHTILVSSSMNVKNKTFAEYSENGDPLMMTFTYGYKLNIFNRYGQSVFTNTNAGWNGSINGQPADTGVYFYVLEYNTVDGSEILKGSIEVVK